jgi:hypothetical protein
MNGIDSQQYWFYLPFYFQSAQGVDATVSGVRTIPLGISQIVAVVVSSVLLPSIGYYVGQIYRQKHRDGSHYPGSVHDCRTDDSDCGNCPLEQTYHRYLHCHLGNITCYHWNWYGFGTPNAVQQCPASAQVSLTRSTSKPLWWFLFTSSSRSDEIPVGNGTFQLT